MPRPATGQILEHVGKDGRTYRKLRFRAGGERYTQPLGVVSRAKAEKALEHLIADIERGIWQPPTAATPPPVIPTVPTFHAFSEEWWTLYVDEWDTGTRDDYKKRLEIHLIPFFGPLRLDEIDFDTIERYKAAKLAGNVYKDGKDTGEKTDPLAASTYNKTLETLSRILERAIKRKLITGNPAADKDLRRTDKKPAKAYLGSAGEISALLDAAGELDQEAPQGRKHIERRAMLATLTFAGLRHDEALALRWRDVNLADGWLSVHGTKTARAERKVNIRGALRDELLALRQRCEDTPQTALVFPSVNGGKLSQSNVRERVLGKPANGEHAGSGTVRRANENLEAAGLPPLPDRLSVQSLRCTFASILYALGEDPGTVMDEMGHGDPGLALRIYRQAMRRGDDEKAKLRALVEGSDWAHMGTRDQNHGTQATATEPVAAEK